MKSDRLYLGHMRDACIAIEQFTQGYLRETFLEDYRTQSAVVRQLEIIGEGARHLSQDFLDQHPEIPHGGILSV